MSKWGESFVSEVKEQINDIKSRMPKFFDDIKNEEPQDNDSEDSVEKDNDTSRSENIQERQDEVREKIEIEKTSTSDSEADETTAKDIKDMSEEEKQQMLQDYLDGKITFDEIKGILAEYYADAVNSNRVWTWGESVPNGDMLTAGQKAKIRDYAIENGLIPVAETRNENGKTYADFSKYKVFECDLPEEKWKDNDQDQFSECNKKLKEAIENDPELKKKFTDEQLDQINNGKTPTGYTWHHSEKDGRMELVPFGVHNSTYHNGGRSEGNWADAPRT